MREILLGKDTNTGRRIRMPVDALRTHLWMIGGTGKGKTTAIETILHQLLLDPFNQACVVVIDRMGGLSFSILRWLASRFCSESVRKRLVYIEPSREDICIPFNPLVYTTPGEGYFKTALASDVILRGWASQNLGEMPRLARWLFNAFWAAAQLGLAIRDTMHFLLPGSPYHAPLLRALPPTLQAEWAEITNARNNQATIILDSTRNRLKPIWESPVLGNIFGSTVNRLDMERFMREKKIVLINLAPNGTLPMQVADAIGGLVINDVLHVARSLPAGVQYPTYLILDEFQRFLGPDLETAIPELRQKGVRILPSHQTLGQLVRGDLDLRPIIFVCQTWGIFGLSGEDADILAHEFASLSFDPMKVKEENRSRRQLISGHRLAQLTNRSESESMAEQWNHSYGVGWDGMGALDPATASTRRGQGDGYSRGRTTSVATSQTYLPEYENFEEISRTYFTFEEQRHLWAQKIRRLRTGRALLRIVNDPTIYEVDVKRSVPGHLAYDWAFVEKRLPEVAEAYHRLLDDNFAQECFVSPRAIELETKRRLERVLTGRLELRSHEPPVINGEAEKEELPQRNPYGT